MLECYCDLYDYEPGFERWTSGNDFEPLNAKRRKRCAACNELIDIGADVVRIERWRESTSEVEIKIYGEEGPVYLCDRFLCEKCGGLLYSLEDLGFECFHYSDTKAAIEEYAEMTLDLRRHD